MISVFTKYLVTYLYYINQRKLCVVYDYSQHGPWTKTEHFELLLRGGYEVSDLQYTQNRK